MNCTLENSAIDDFEICNDHIHYRSRKIPRPVMSITHTIGHGIVFFLDQIGEIIERSPHMMFAFIASRVGGRLCPRHDCCFYLPRCIPFPSDEDIETALIDYLDTYVFCSKCDNPQNMDLTLDFNTDNLKAICRNRFCNATYILPPFEYDFEGQDEPDCAPPCPPNSPQNAINNKKSAAIKRAIRASKKPAEGEKRQVPPRKEAPCNVQGHNPCHPVETTE